MRHRDVMKRLREVHEAAQGNGSQGAFDVSNVVADILKEKE